MLTTAINKNSYSFEDFEKQMVVQILKEYFVYNISDNNGVYLNDIDLDNIDFKWCCGFTDSSAIYGSWSPLYFNSIYLKPTLYSSAYRAIYEEEHPHKIEMIGDINKYPQYRLVDQDGNVIDGDSDTQISEGIYQIVMRELEEYERPFIDFDKNGSINVWQQVENKYWIADFEKWHYLKYLLGGNDGEHIINTICHELYHKWQFSAKPPLTPIFYIANFFISLFIGYENACKLSWTIEGDVRKSVDNEHMAELLDQFNDCFLTLNQYAIVQRELLILENEEYKQKILSKYGEVDGKDTIKNYQDHVDCFYGKNVVDGSYDLFEREREIRKTDSFSYLLKILKQYEILTPQFIEFAEKN